MIERILVIGCLLSGSCVGCGRSSPPAAAPETTEPQAKPAAEDPANTPGRPQGKRAPCVQDQDCNGEASVSALHGRCIFESGVCECNAGFVLSPDGYCQPQAAAEESPESADMDMATMWKEFASAWNARDSVALARFNAAQGLLVLDNPGAFVRLRSFTNIAGFFAEAGPYDGNRVPQHQFSLSYSPDAAPKVSCESDVLPQGVFLAETGRAQVADRYKALTTYELADEKTIEKLRPVVDQAKQVRGFAVYDLKQSVGFLFSTHGGRPTLVAIDAVVPCSA